MGSMPEQPVRSRTPAVSRIPGWPPATQRTRRSRTTDRDASLRRDRTPRVATMESCPPLWVPPTRRVGMTIATSTMVAVPVLID